MCHARCFAHNRPIDWLIDLRSIKAAPPHILHLSVPRRRVHPTTTCVNGFSLLPPRGRLLSWAAPLPRISPATPAHTHSHPYNSHIYYHITVYLLYHTIPIPIPIPHSCTSKHLRLVPLALFFFVLTDVSNTTCLFFASSSSLSPLSPRARVPPHFVWDDNDKHFNKRWQLIVLLCFPSHHHVSSRCKKIK